ncbi:hypothetical protein E2562_025795 [Oryza meyeriana var. granulata]|uniref:Uncharacterized protein n=1 Tax=Oryza meyeriana var. granulata TaxID=110450 RepID=A0A6G1CRW4_9ORYZ|nr:hypothetical protein E2562_025795 [Oryza meyeriana var. granulata]
MDLVKVVHALQQVDPHGHKFGDLGDDGILGRGGSTPASFLFFLHHLSNNGGSTKTVGCGNDV